jgi:hypothetical protein
MRRKLIPLLEVVRSTSLEVVQSKSIASHRNELSDVRPNHSKPVNSPLRYLGGPFHLKQRGDDPRLHQGPATDKVQVEVNGKGCLNLFR